MWVSLSHEEYDLGKRDMRGSSSTTAIVPCWQGGLRDSLLLGAIGEKAEVTDAHEPIGQDVKQEATDEFLGLESEGLFSISVFAISIAQGDQAVLHVEDTIVGQRDAVGVAA